MALNVSPWGDPTADVTFRQLVRTYGYELVLKALAAFIRDGCDGHENPVGPERALREAIDFLPDHIKENAIAANGVVAMCITRHYFER